jgi:hypothetical protein
MVRLLHLGLVALLFGCVSCGSTTAEMDHGRREAIIAEHVAKPAGLGGAPRRPKQIMSFQLDLPDVSYFFITNDQLINGKMGYIWEVYRIVAGRWTALSEPVDFFYDNLIAVPADSLGRPYLLITFQSADGPSPTRFRALTTTPAGELDWVDIATLTESEKNNGAELLFKQLSAASRRSLPRLDIRTIR